MPPSRETFLDVFEAYNQAVWPGQGLALALALVLVGVAFVLRGQASAWRAVTGALAALWLWMGVVYHWVFFAPINPAAWIFGGLFVVQAGLFCVAALRGPGSTRAPSKWSWGMGLGLLTYALVVYPLLGQFSDHPYPRSPTFGLPCPTTIFSFGVLSLLSPRPSWWLIIIPSMWALIGSFAPFAFGIWEDLGLGASALLVILSFVAGREHPPPAAVG